MYYSGLFFDTQHLCWYFHKFEILIFWLTLMLTSCLCLYYSHFSCHDFDIVIFDYSKHSGTFLISLCSLSFRPETVINNYSWLPSNYISFHIIRYLSALMYQKTLPPMINSIFFSRLVGDQTWFVCNSMQKRLKVLLESLLHHQYLLVT